MWPTIYLNKKDKLYYLVDTACFVSVYNWGEVSPLLFLGITQLLFTVTLHFLHKLP